MANILVIADESWVVGGVEAALSETRFSITSVDDPRTAVEACKEHDPDVVIVDLQIGSMGGMAVTRIIREAAGADRITGVPVLILLDRRADAFLARRAGADAWLQKPIEAFALRDLIDDLVSPKRTSQGDISGD